MGDPEDDALDGFCGEDLHAVDQQGEVPVHNRHHAEDVSRGNDRHGPRHGPEDAEEQEPPVAPAPDAREERREGSDERDRGVMKIAIPP